MNVRRTSRANVVARQLLYRGMTADGTRPKIGNTARNLGVRNEEITVVGDNVLADGKGMSTAHGSPENLPAFRRSEAFGGTGKDPVWQIEDGTLPATLISIIDGETHATIAPAAQMLLTEYRQALADTQPSWSKTPVPTEEKKD